MKLLIRWHMPHYSAFHDCIQRNNQLLCDKFIKSFYLIFEFFCQMMQSISTLPLYYESGSSG